MLEAQSVKQGTNKRYFISKDGGKGAGVETSDVSTHYKYKTEGFGAKHNEAEDIEFAGFLSDFDPSLLFLLTYCEGKNVSYLKVLKIEKREDKRSYSLVAHE